jgi:glycosyltransferase involved in cell wall biosynthesis
LQQIRFSIAIPAHNGVAFLPVAIESALNQSRTADEVIVVDDASTDYTRDIVLGSDFKKYVKYFYNDNSTGFVDAWNRAITRVSGDFVTILHQDDVLHIDYLKNIENALLKYNQVKHIYSACNYIDEQGSIIKMASGSHWLEPMLYTGKQYARNYLNGIISNNHIHRCPGVTTETRLLLNKCRYRREAGVIADDDFFLRVGAFTDVIGIAYPLASYREHASSQTHSLPSLALQLAKDYVFQTNYYREHNRLLDPEGVLKINQMAVRFINLLFFQALLYKNKEWFKNAYDLRDELEHLLDSPMGNNSPLWARLMWAISGLNKKNYLLRCYVMSLNSIRKVRDLIRKP